MDTNDILDNHNYLMKGTWYKVMFEVIKKIFIGLLISTANASNPTMSILLINQKFMISPTLTNLHPNEYSQEFQ